jgi:cyclopropane fatty-acyl-phospholipid synthase-like methyltransferase
MLRVVTKDEYWHAEDAGYAERTANNSGFFQIKNIQDVVLLSRIDGIHGKQVLEVGGGHSRVLSYLSATNDCTNVDPLEGNDGGPAGQLAAELGYKQIYALIGSSHDVIADSTFDLLISVSVVEHIPLPDLPAFWADCARILKPGGRMVHMIDTYLGVDEDVNYEATSRFSGYKEAFDAGFFLPYDPSQVAAVEDIKFNPTMASNPDNVMNIWNSMAPTMRPLRAKSAAVTYVMDGTKA